MKNFKLFMLPLVVFTAFTFSACSDDDETPTPTDNTTMSTTIVDVAKTNDFTILVSALERVELDDVLMGDGPFTVFAPTDDAFTALLAELKIDGLDKVDDATLTQILLNHVVDGKVTSDMLAAGYVSTMADGPEDTKISALIDLTNGVMINNRSIVSTPDVMASNGVIHIIDKVITIPNSVDAALANPSFGILVQALTRSDLTIDFVATLSSEGPFTIFAPTDQAFLDLLAGNDDWDALADIPVAVLEAVLKYHVIAGTNVTASEITDGMQPQTFEGSTITINNTSGVQITDANMNVSTVQIADVQTSNGVIHAIDKVIIPKL